MEYIRDTSCMSKEGTLKIDYCTVQLPLVNKCNPSAHCECAQQPTIFKMQSAEPVMVRQ